MNPLTTERLYTRQFFQAFAAVILFMTGVALQFHFGQYLEYLGHGVDTLGRVLGISMVGTLLIRLRIGGWIDRFGCRPMWLIGTVVVALAIGSIQLAQQLWLIVVLRAVASMATAAVMTTVAVFAAQIAPPRRRAESIGIIGLGGFLGMTIGPALGDWIFGGQGQSIVPYRIFFSASAACSLCAGAIMAFFVIPPIRSPADAQLAAITDHQRAPASPLQVVRQHWPGPILLVGAAFSMVFCLQSLFLERLAEDRGFQNIKVFFLVYCPTAIILRILFRRLPETVGRTRTLLGGMTLMTIGLVCMIGVRTQGQLMLPGILMGAGHSFVFPSMIDLAAERLPAHYRGTGTALILAAGDVGMLTGYVALGEVIQSFGFDTALLVLAATVALGTGCFAMSNKTMPKAPRAQGGTP